MRFITKRKLLIVLIGVFLVVTAVSVYNSELKRELAEDVFSNWKDAVFKTTRMNGDFAGGVVALKESKGSFDDVWMAQRVDPPDPKKGITCYNCDLNKLSSSKRRVWIMIWLSSRHKIIDCSSVKSSYGKPIPVEIYGNCYDVVGTLRANKGSGITSLDKKIADEIEAQFGNSFSKDSKVEKTKDTFAYGSTSGPSDASGYAWMAVKANGKWNTVWQGQQSPTCDVIDEYKIPQEIYGTCYEVKYFLSPDIKWGIWAD